MFNRVRKAGQYLIDQAVDLDKRYAARANKDMGNNALSQMLGGQPLTAKQQYTTRDELNQIAQNNYGRDATRSEVLMTQGAERAIVGGALLTNAGYRYGLPAAGVTLAGKGLMDLTAQFGGGADQQEPNQLPL